MTYRVSYVAIVTIAVLACSFAPGAARNNDRPLRIATTGNIGTGSEEKAMTAAETLLNFVQEETGLEAKLDRMKSWEDVVGAMKRGQIGLGVFQGFEFAWAQELDPKLRPLVVGINVHQYPVLSLVTAHNSPAAGLSALRGQALSIPKPGHSLLRLFQDREVQGLGSTTDSFFSKVVSPPNAEDALDDVVDGVVQAAVVDRVALEMYERRQPARFRKLKRLKTSPPFPPALIAYYDEKVDAATLRRFEQGVMGAPTKRKGQNVLQIMRLTAFAAPPNDLNTVLADMRKAYPRPKE